MDSILPFFKRHSKELVNWGLFVSLLAAQQVNSAGAERVFSVLKQAFHELQAGSLCDYVETVIMRKYNCTLGNI